MLQLLAWAQNGVPAGGLPRALAAEIIGYVTAWAGFALLSLPMAEARGRKADWPRFIAAWNWANAVQYLVLLVLSLPALLGLPDLLAGGLWLAAFGYALWLEWFVTREALRLPGGAAVLFVAFDVMLNIFVRGFVSKLSGG